MTVRLGPANLTFRGAIEVKASDPATGTLQLSAKGTDTTGASVAAMELTARVEPAADGLSSLIGTSEASVGGKAAAFGGRMMDAASDQILKQFAANFAAQIDKPKSACRYDEQMSEKDQVGCRYDDPKHSAAGFAQTCEQCHHSTTTWQGAHFDAHDFPIYSGAHSGFACSQCHLTNTNYNSFSCTHCHAHSQSSMNSRHSDVGGYRLSSIPRERSVAGPGCAASTAAMDSVSASSQRAGSSSPAPSPIP